MAQRVGVTPPSIYLHFADKDALLDAVCVRYFEKLDEEMQEVAGRAGGDVGASAVDVLRAQGLAYVRFALKTPPELYRIATMGGQGSPGSDVDMTLNSSAFVHMRTSVEALIDEGGIYPPGGDPHRPGTRAVDRGARCGGAADLPSLPAWGGDVEEFADRVLRSVCCGHIVSGAIRPADPPRDTVTWLKEAVDERNRR